MKRIVFYSYILATGFISCTEVNNVISAGDKPIIEAYLAPNQPIELKVFSEIPYLEEDSSFSVPLENLNIQISSSTGKVWLLTYTENGIYKSTENLGSAGEVYSLNFEYNGRVVSASTTIPVVPSGLATDQSEIYRTALDLSSGVRPSGGFGGANSTPISITWQNPDNVYHFVAAQYLEATLDPVVILPTNETGFSRPPQRFNNEPILGTANNMQVQQFEYFGSYALILYRLNPDYAALYENSGTSSQNIATPLSTISNGLGIFTGINADTLVIEVKRQL